MTHIRFRSGRGDGSSGRRRYGRSHYWSLSHRGKIRGLGEARVHHFDRHSKTLRVNVGKTGTRTIILRQNFELADGLSNSS